MPINNIIHVKGKSNTDCTDRTTYWDSAPQSIASCGCFAFWSIEAAVSGEAGISASSSVDFYRHGWWILVRSSVTLYTKNLRFAVNVIDIKTIYCWLTPSALLLPVSVFNSNYCPSSSPHSEAWPHPSVFEDMTATTAQCRFLVYQELSLNKLWHDWMIWSASMVRPQSPSFCHMELHYAWRLFPRFNRQQQTNLEQRVTAEWHWVRLSCSLFPLLPSSSFSCSMSPSFGSVFSCFLSGTSVSCAPHSPSPSYCVLFAAFWTLTVSPLKERPRSSRTVWEAYI